MSTSAIGRITTCTLCGQRFTAPAAVLIGETADRMTTRFVIALAQHFEQYHPGEYVRDAIAGQEYIGLLVLRHFLTNDPSLNRISELTRHRIHDRTTARRISDEMIRAKVAALALPITENDTARLTDLIRDMRDILQEAGAFAPGGVPVSQPTSRPPPDL